FEESVGGDLRAFLDWAALQGTDLARVHEPVLPETDDDHERYEAAARRRELRLILSGRLHLSEAAHLRDYIHAAAL
ncbi:MAG: hypothetical protein AAFX85_18710, partial [Pseudomonadota bacterium]